MAHDARKEDYQRLGLRFIRQLDREDSGIAMKAFAGFGQRFSTDRDSLPQTDSDRAFHLVSKAADLIDYQLPFADATHAGELVVKGSACCSRRRRSTQTVSTPGACSRPPRSPASRRAMSFSAKKSQA